jgi:hypothetical protein
MPNPLIKNSFLAIVTLCKHKAEEKNLNPVISVSKITDMLRASGLRITYQQIVDLTKDPTIAPSIKSINQNQIEFNLGDEEASAPVDLDFDQGQEAPPENGEEHGEGNGEEYNPDDFSFPEGEGQEGQAPQENPNDEMANQGQGPQPSVISAMAKRAMNRPD